jgi:tetratricopeptide (TPR) repeat protein
LREQGRWAESREVLETIAQDCHPEIERLKHVQEILLQWTSGAAEVHDAGRLLASLFAHASQEGSSRLRLRAIGAASYIISMAHDREHSQQFLNLTCKLESAIKDAREKNRLQEFILRFAYYGDIPMTAQRADDALRTLEGRGGSEVNRHLGHSEYMALGAQRASGGDYEEALSSWSEAYVSAKRVSNWLQQARAAGNVALAHFRLGRTRESLDWALLGLEHLSGHEDVAFFKLIHLAAWGKAMTGDERAALTLLNSLRGEHLFKEFAWARQAALLLESDVLYALGRERESVEMGRSATSSDLGSLTSKAYAGAWARAQARLGIAMGECEGRLDLITRMSVEVVGPDQIDTAEISSASILLKQKLGMNAQIEKETLEGALRRLPTAVPKFLEILGFGGLL